MSWRIKNSKIKVYLVAVFMVSFLSCLVLSTLIVSTSSQEVKDIGSRKHITFRVDNSFSRDQIQEIGRAFVRWESASDNYVSLNMYLEDISFLDLFSWLSDKKPTIYNASSVLSWKRQLVNYITTSNHVLGGAMYESGDIFLVDDVPKRFEIVATHEIGHIFLGDFHSRNENSVMYPTIGMETSHKYITFEDISLLLEKVK